MKLGSAAVFAIAASAVVLLAIVAGLVVIGSPSEVRAQRLDEQRVRNLQAIASAIERHRRTNDTVPASLVTLRQSEQQVALPIEDPESRELYDYRATGASSYELCALFDTVLNANDGRIPAFWSHSAGRHCFLIDVKPQAPR